MFLATAWVWEEVLDGNVSGWLETVFLPNRNSVTKLSSPPCTGDWTQGSCPLGKSYTTEL